MNIGEEIKIDHEFIMLADDKNERKHSSNYIIIQLSTKGFTQVVAFQKTFITTILIITPNTYLSERLIVKFVAHLYLNQTFSLLE